MTTAIREIKFNAPDTIYRFPQVVDPTTKEHARNVSMINRFLEAFPSRPCEGDVVRHDNGGVSRIANCFGSEHHIEMFHWQPAKYFSTYVNLYEGGGSFSGTLDPSFDTRLVLTDELIDANWWTFCDNDVRAHNGIYFTVPTRVWKAI